MDDFENNLSENETLGAEASEDTAETTATAAEQSTMETSASDTYSYNANIPGPTKYDHPYRTYQDTAHSSQTPQSTNTDKQGFAITALIMGIVSMLCIFIPIAGWVFCFPLGIIGIIFGILGRKSSKHTMSLVGLILSAVALGICLLLIIISCILLILAFAGYAGNNGSLPREYSYYFRSVLPYIID